MSWNYAAYRHVSTAFSYHLNQKTSRVTEPIKRFHDRKKIENRLGVITRREVAPLDALDRFILGFLDLTSRFDLAMFWDGVDVGRDPVEVK
jgi:hypothetical protein